MNRRQAVIGALLGAIAGLFVRKATAEEKLAAQIAALPEKYYPWKPGIVYIPWPSKDGKSLLYIKGWLVKNAGGAAYISNWECREDMAVIVGKSEQEMLELEAVLRRASKR